MQKILDNCIKQVEEEAGFLSKETKEVLINALFDKTINKLFVSRKEIKL